MYQNHNKEHKIENAQKGNRTTFEAEIKKNIFRTYKETFIQSDYPK